jgi:hypothetical protein
MATSWRDRKLALEKEVAALAKSFTGLTDITAKIANLQTRVADVEEQISILSKASYDIYNSDTDSANPDKLSEAYSYDAQRRVLDKAKSALSTQLQDLKVKDLQSKVRAEVSASLAISTAANGVATTATGEYGGGLNVPGAIALKYNATSVKEAYFSTRPSFQAQLDGKGKLKGVMRSANQPSTVRAATELWNSAAASKGMIVTSQASLAAWNSGSAKQIGTKYERQNYGFQFQYNPGTVAMTYFTAPNVDPALYTSGQEMFNLSGVSGSQGSVSFQIVINRIFDMQYYNSLGYIRDGVVKSSIYSKPPLDNEEVDVYNKGTMYDIEYLLRTLMGFTMDSYLRGNNTSDMGWLPATPVELHLGKTMRYLGTVNSVSLNHMIFDERMVPLLTTVDIAFARLPDYPMTTVGAQTGTTSI